MQALERLVRDNTLKARALGMQKSKGWHRHFVGEPIHSLSSISANLVEPFPGAQAIAFACPVCRKERHFAFLKRSGQDAPQLPFKTENYQNHWYGKIPLKHWRGADLHYSIKVKTFNVCTMHIAISDNGWLFTGHDNYAGRYTPVKHEHVKKRMREKPFVNAFAYFAKPNDYTIDELRGEVEMTLDIPNLLEMLSNLKKGRRRRLEALIRERIAFLRTPVMQAFLEQDL